MDVRRCLAAGRFDPAVQCSGKNTMNVAMIGAGYVGLVSGACFAEFGYNVVCVDNDPGIVARLNAGDVTFYEPGLEEILVRNRQQGRLSFSTDLEAGVRGADVVVLAVGTPSRHEGGEADMQYIDAAADQVAAAMKPGAVIVIKSTVVVGTNARIGARMQVLRPGVDFSVASNPEFLREGSAVADFMQPDRVVIGVGNERAGQVMRQLYQPLHARAVPLIVTSAENAELIKYAANAFLALKVTFINQVADLCEKTGGDVQEVARAIGIDKRIGASFLRAGPGFGGSCFPKDTLAFVATGKALGAPQQLIENVIAINETRKQMMAARIIAAAARARTRCVAVLGVAFKPDTDDIRKSPAIDMIAALLHAGFEVRAHDPEAMTAARAVFPDIGWCSSPYEAVAGAGVAVIMTEWDIYRRLDLKKLASLMEKNVLMDLRNIYKAEDLAGTGLDYHCVGRTLVH